MVEGLEAWGLLAARGEIQLWIKVLYTFFVCLLVPVYWVKYGPANFLWFSDIALLSTAAARWLESSFLASMMAVGVLALELVWMLDYLWTLLKKVHPIGMSRYMFDKRIPRFVRGLSLFHVVLPFFLVWLVHRLGYHPRSWIAQTILAWMVLLVTYHFTDPSKNINWAFGLGDKPQKRLPGPLYLALLMVSLPLIVYLPTHLALQAVFGRR